MAPSWTLTELPYIDFLSAYPHPAFILPVTPAIGKERPSLNPVFGNPAFRSLVYGPDVDTADVGGGLLEALDGIAHAQRLGDWIAGLEAERSRRDTIVVDLKPRWLHPTAAAVQLEITGTRMADFWVCTSVPRTPVPRYSPPNTPVLPRQDSGRSTTTLVAGQRRTTSFASDLRPKLKTDVPEALQRLLEPPSGRLGEMAARVANYDWASTSLGPLSQWPQSLRSILSYVLACPYPTCLWWGPEFMLIYNDGYADMAGSKHPSIFGQSGSVAWGELWETIGPLARQVIKGEAIAKTDDLLFFDRLTSEMLPEETYHCWSWTPVLLEDGSCGGLVNTTFETTSKVILQRRLDCLRDLANSTALSGSLDSYAEAVLAVLSNYSLDLPFAALYYCSSDATASANNSEAPQKKHPHIQNTAARPPINVTLRLAGSVGIPDGHPSMPPLVEMALDPVTFRSSPPIEATPTPSTDSIPAVASLDLKGYKSPSPPSTIAEGITPSVLSDISGSTLMPTTSRQRHASLWPIADALTSRRAVHMRQLPRYLVDGFGKRGWGDPLREAVVVPVATEGEELPTAVLILGLNTRLPYDEAFQMFVDVTRMSLGSTLNAALGREAETRRADQLAELDSAKTMFFSNVSHELRTPLTLISGPLQDSVRDLKDKKVKDQLSLALRNVSRLSRLVDSLMDFSKLAAKQLQGHFRPVQLGPLTADLAALFRGTIEKSRIEFIVECDEDDSKLTCVDPDWWEKIVFNLIGNAFKYTIRGAITVRVQYTEENALFSVEDTGVGIPPDDIDKVFNRFHRVASVSRSFEGTGIGLALTKELVNLHGGELTVASRTEKLSEDGSHGSIFTVALKYGRDHLDARLVNEQPLDFARQQEYARGVVEEATQWSTWSESDDTPSESSDSGGSSNDSSMPLFFDKKDIILLVDDSADMRRYITSLFSRYCAVVEVRNGQEALDLCDQGKLRPTVVLTDVMMPVMDGYKLMQELRARDHTRLIPVILITANAGDEARVDGLLSGADDYLTKPFKSREMIARVHLQMQLGKRRAELEARFEERTKEIQILSELSTVGIGRTDSTGKLIYVNPRWRALCGLSDDKSIDDWPELIHPDDLPGLLEAWQAAFTQHHGVTLDFRFANGTYCIGSMEPISVENGVLTGMIGTITDVTTQRAYEASQLAHAQERESNARKRAEEAEERRKEADERRRGQELLIDVTSHELRQPVSAILNCSSLVRSNLAVLRDDLSRCASQKQSFRASPTLIKMIDEDLEALDAIYQCGLAQERIANDVLSLSRIQLQVLSIHPVEFDLIPEIRKIVSIFRNEVKMKKIDLSLHVGKSIGRLKIGNVRSDKSRFGQVITNLLSNAIKFTDTSTGKRAIDVTVEVSREPPDDGGCQRPVDRDDPVPEPSSTALYVYLAVQDSGPGLKPDDLTLLFQRFQQGTNSHDVFGGSGLGLFVSRKLCDLMGGRIQVDSVYGQGATFRFFIEMQTSAHVTPQTTPDPFDGPSATNGSMFAAFPVESSPMPPLHILITEDNIINQTVLNRQLKKAGCTTALASNGLQAIEEVRGLANLDPLERNLPRRFDAILMDLEMPVCDGVTAVREIRQMEESGELPHRNLIYALTGNARAAQIQLARDAGMDDVIIKPYKIDELLKKLRGP